MKKGAETQESPGGTSNGRGLDLYLWLTYRTFALRAPLRLTWRSLYHQFEADPSKAGNHDTVQYFRRKVLRELKKIKLAWPELNYSTVPGVLMISIEQM